MSAPSLQSQKALNFRLDINGLRAWAVLGVVLYHFDVAYFESGFIGVDVFFVISGFLMAGVIIGQLEQSRFSIGLFYLARAKRIIPPLLAMIMATLVVGWFLLMPTDYQLLGRHARESALFTSNLTYLSEFGYFDARAAEKWLLHTWSLSVEWQFYLIYPLLLSLLFRLSRSTQVLMAAHGVLLLASLVYATITTWSDPNAAFFLLTARAWELVIGSAVFIISRSGAFTPSLARVLEGTGMMMIIASMLLIDADRSWPGLPALVPVLGAGLVLLAGRSQSFWTTPAILQWIGLRSYSIYLWHWPIVALLNYFYLQHSTLWLYAGIAASILFGHLSYLLIESPTRKVLSTWAPGRGALTLAACVLCVATSAQLVRGSGFPSRLPESVAPLEAQRNDTNPRQKECLGSKARCVFGGAEVDAIVIGDSHASALVSAVAAANPNAESGILLRAESGCLITHGAQWHGKGDYTSCESLLTALNEELRDQHPGIPLIVVNRLALYLKGEDSIMGGKSDSPLINFGKIHEKPTPEFIAEFTHHYTQTICKLGAHRPVYLLTPTPEMAEKVPRAMSRGVLRGRPTDITVPYAEYLQRNKEALSAQAEAVSQCGARILDSAKYLCDAEQCYGSKGGTALYTDDNHMSEQGNKILVPLFQSVFRDAEA